MRLIDADKAEQYFYEHLDDLHMAGAMNAIREMPTIEAEPVKHGHWVADWYCNHAKEFLCSVCNSTVYYDYYTRSIDYDYCPYCGARMDSQKLNIMNE